MSGSVAFATFARQTMVAMAHLSLLVAVSTSPAASQTVGRLVGGNPAESIAAGVKGLAGHGLPTRPAATAAPVAPTESPSVKVTTEPSPDSAAAVTAPEKKTAAADATSQPTPAGPAAPSVLDADDARTNQMLAAEQKVGTQLHPIQTASPELSIVVCEAGCGDQKAHVVFQKSKTLVVSATAELAASKTSLTSKRGECRGGCDYLSNTRQASIAPGMSNKSDLADPSTTTWMTAPKPVAPAAGEPAAAKPAEPEKAASVKAEPNRASREDWMARINKERAAERAAREDRAVVFPSEPVVQEHNVPENSVVRE